MNIFKRIKDAIVVWYEKYFGEYEPIREFDFQKAQEFYEKNRSVLMEMALCMGFDDFVWQPIIEMGNTVVAPISSNNVDGVTRTFYDVPCIYICYDSGVESKLYCFKEYWYNKKSKTYKYRNPLYGSLMVHKFGVFEESDFENRFEKRYGNVVN